MAPASRVLIAMAAVMATASLSSMIGSAFILICYAILPFGHHFRHILILNLALSDFLHSFNNAAADLYVLAHKRTIDPSLMCTLNGFVEQVTDQATDCSILAITITTVYAITRRVPISTTLVEHQYKRIALICCAIWIFPFFTGFLALGMGWYGPVTGSWCWIKDKPKYLRYVLTHNWRFLFIISEISLYVYLDIHLRRHFQMLSGYISSRGLESEPTPSEAHHDPTLHSPVSEFPMQAVKAGQVDGDSNIRPAKHIVDLDHSSTVGVVRKVKPQGRFRLPRILGLRRRNQRASGTIRSSDTHYQAVQRALLLNSYPLAYIILWIPAIVNRFIEITGHSSTVLQFLQVTAQLIGLANALTYGWNERVAHQLKERFSGVV
ncbi:hypothetical protein F5887DRAFT_264433 [Amanita rubescens]|nr:hypothetical protein F5887DRAFT_264433 [Amanita rubescens]